MANNANTPIFVGDASASRTSSPIETRGKSCLRIHVAVTADGSPAGAITLEGSEDKALANEGMSVPNPATVSWIPLTIPTAAIHGTGLTVAGVNNTLIIVTDLPTWVRVKYTRTGGGNATPNSLRIWVGHSE
jgi:hypothetical protein